jgi:hypothetical protein
MNNDDEMIKTVMYSIFLFQGETVVVCLLSLVFVVKEKEVRIDDDELWVAALFMKNTERTQRT